MEKETPHNNYQFNNESTALEQSVMTSRKHTYIIL